MKIKKLLVKNLKKFKNLEIEFQDLDCVVGTNNSGKSTLLQALALFDFCVHQCLSKNNGKGFELKARSISEEDFVVLPIVRVVDLWHNKKTQEKKKHIIIEINVFFENEKEVLVKIDLSFNRLSVNTITQNDQNWLQQLHEFKISYLPVFSSFMPKEEKRTNVTIRNELAKGNVNVVIRNLLHTLKEQNKTDKLTDIIKETFVFIKNLKIEFDEANMQYINVSYTEENASKEFDIFSAGSGFQQFIYLFGFILLENPNIILLDEPDVHLHGELQKKLFSQLKKLVEQDEKQIIFATHSRDLIANNGNAPENIINLHNNTAKRLSLDYEVYNVLENLGSLDNNQLIKLQEHKKVLVLENREDWDFLEIFAEKILTGERLQKLRNCLAIRYAEGNPRKQDMPNLQKSLQQMFIEKGETIKIFVLCDRDYYIEREEFLTQKAQDKTHQHLTWYIWQKNEIQNYLLVENAFLSVLNENKDFEKKSQKDKEILKEDIKTKLLELTELQKNDIYHLFLKSFDEYNKEKKHGWDISTVSRNAQEYIGNHWEAEKMDLVDAKKIISAMSNWFQNQKWKSFSVKNLAQKINKEDIFPEISELLEKICVFAGV